MYHYKQIKAVHVEITERCNLSCLMCDRNMNGGDVNPFLKNRELSTEILEDTFTEDFCKQLDRVYFCGNYGDPILANALLPTLYHLKDYNPKMKTSVITNGCARKEIWWERLATVTNSVRFGIDGLEDTHKLYRQGADFNLIIRNAQAYINAGGHAIWDYLVFGHNEHQIEDARKLADALGFAEFVVKKTGRFFSNLRLKGKDEHMGLKKPSEKNVNNSLKKQQKIANKYGSMEKYLDQVAIDCKVMKNKEIYISAEGYVLPCCWLAGQLYKWFMPEKSGETWKLLTNGYQNIHYHSIKDIFNSGIFETIQKTWLIPTIKDGKLKTCALKCGVEMDQFGDQFK